MNLRKTPRDLRWTSDTKEKTRPTVGPLQPSRLGRDLTQEPGVPQVPDDPFPTPTLHNRGWETGLNGVHTWRGHEKRPPPSVVESGWRMAGKRGSGTEHPEDVGTREDPLEGLTRD